MTTLKRYASIALAAGLALVPAMTAAHNASPKDVTIVATPPEDALTERVSYADLDLASAQDVRRLNFRVGAAVNRVCAPLDQRSTYAKHNACRSFARNGAKPQVERAIARARELASTGTTAIAPVAILIAAPQR